MKRTLTLIGSILGTVANAIYTLITFFALSVLGLFGDIAAEEIGSIPVFVFVILILDLAFCIVSLIFDAITISVWKKEPADYKKKKGIVITSVVFDFLTVIALLIDFSVVSVLFALVLIASNVLKIIDLSNEDKKAKEYLEQKSKPQVKTAQPSVVKPVAPTAESKTEGENFETLEKRLVKLISMREKGLINEDEYNELKKELIHGDMKK